MPLALNFSGPFFGKNIKKIKRNTPYSAVERNAKLLQIILEVNCPDVLIKRRIVTKRAAGKSA